MNTSRPAELTALLKDHGEFVRALARTLVLDGGEADDVSQETWLAALRHPPERERGQRSWLSAVVRRIVSRTRRDARRRQDREHLAARPEATEANDGENDEELWKSDGTTRMRSTDMLRRPEPGAASCTP